MVLKEKYHGVYDTMGSMAIKERSSDISEYSFMEYAKRKHRN
jgi:hypothetical protein